MVWIEFTICSSLMIFFAYQLCKEGIILSQKTHLEEGLIGMFFLAIATSFPEIVTGSTAVFYLDKIGLGYGDIIGSLIVNLMILFFLDYFAGGGRILLRISRITRRTGIFALVLLATVFVFAAMRLLGVKVPSFGRIGGESILIAVMYIACLEVVRRTNHREEKEVYKSEESFLRLWAKFILFLVIVMVLGVWLARIGEKIVNTTNLSQTFTGALFLGLATSFPEMIVTFAALRAGSIDMAVGNIFGSNLFDTLIIPVLDALSKTPILGILTAGQMAGTAVAVLMTACAVLAVYTKRDTSRRVNWDTGLIFAIGFIGFMILYFVR
jgi:cation:H+ antiporter